MFLVCLVVTCQGWGDVWSHNSRTEAWLHPLTQYGDAIMECEDDVIQEYNSLEWNSLANKVGVELTGYQKSSLSGAYIREARQVVTNTAGTIWNALLGVAVPILEDAEQICNQITIDRRRSTVAKKVVVKAEGAAETVEKKEKTGAPRGRPMDATIHMLRDKSGKHYGADNNPKKAGSNGGIRFAMYVDGMTVEAAIKKGIWTQDISWDIDKGFIEVKGGTAKAPKPVKAAAPIAPANETGTEAETAAAA
jgi:hypothetical protein